jgi:hypothetical protein
MTHDLSTSEQDIVALIADAIGSTWQAADGADRFPSRHAQAEEILHALYDNGYIVVPDETVANLHITIYQLRSTMQRALHDTSNYAGPATP